MYFVKSPWAWLIVAVGILINIAYNETQTIVTNLDGFLQALIGSAVVVVIVAGIALLMGEKFER